CAAVRVRRRAKWHRRECRSRPRSWFCLPFRQNAIGRKAESRPLRAETRTVRLATNSFSVTARGGCRMPTVDNAPCLIGSEIADQGPIRGLLFWRKQSRQQLVNSV